MSQELRWSELRGGIIAAAAITLLVLATLMFARVGGLRGKKVTLYVLAEQVSGVLAGTEVWLAGKKAGLVTDVAFLPPSADTLERLIITTEFLRDALPNVRRDSYAQIRAGGSLIGTPVIFISAGSPLSPALGDGDTIHVRAKVQVMDVTAQVARIGPEFTALANEVNTLTTKISQPTGTIGSFQRRGFPDMPDVGARMARISGKMTGGRGTIGLATRGNFMARASRVMAAADSVKALVSSDKGTLGRFRRDSTLAVTGKGILAQLDSLSALASNPMGTIGGGDPDSTLVRELAKTRTELAALLRDIKSHPMRYINF